MPDSDRHSVFKALAKTADTCAKCGACVPECPVYQTSKNEADTARGRLHILARLAADNQTRRVGEILSRCLLCGACRKVCSRAIDTPRLVQEARAVFPAGILPSSREADAVRTLLKHPTSAALAIRAAQSVSPLLDALLPKQSGMRIRLAALGREIPIAVPASLEQRNPDPEEESDATVFYFSGCMAAWLEPEIGRATLRLARLAGQKTVLPSGQACCGLAFGSAGDMATMRSLAKKNIQAFEASRGPILTSCASCFHQLSRYPDLFAQDDPWHKKAAVFAGRLQEFSTFFAARLACKEARQNPGRKNLRVYHHTPCHLKNSKMGNAAQKILQQMAAVTLANQDSGSKCCGGGGLFNCYHPETSRAVFAMARQQYLEADADLVTTTCTGCLLQWRQGLFTHGSGSAVHLARLLDRSLCREEK